jgi:hypothetical protein
LAEGRDLAIDDVPLGPLLLPELGDNDDGDVTVVVAVAVAVWVAEGAPKLVLLLLLLTNSPADVEELVEVGITSRPS